MYGAAHTWQGSRTEESVGSDDAETGLAFARRG